MKSHVKISINDHVFKVEKGKSVLSICNEKGFDVPSLCHNEALKPCGACRLCMVEVTGGSYRKGLTASCTLKADEGLEILTNTEKIKKHRKILFELYLAEAPESKVIKEMAEKYGVAETRFPKQRKKDDPLNNKCVLCGQCVRICEEVMHATAIYFTGRGHLTTINTPYLQESDVCLGCKACVEVCPTGAVDYEDVNGFRIMKSWSNTKIALAKCPECGRFFVPEPLISSALEKMDTELKKTLSNICPICRRNRL